MESEDSIHRYSIWLLFEGHPNTEAEFVISNLASKHGSTKFMPHVTLISTVKGRESELLLILRDFAYKSDVLKLDFGRISQSDKYYKTVFVNIKNNSSLQSAHDIGTEVFNAEKSEFMPHVSLIYAKLGESERKKIISQVGASYFSNFQGVFATYMALAFTEGDEKGWYVAGKFPI